MSYVKRTKSFSSGFAHSASALHSSHCSASIQPKRAPGYRGQFTVQSVQSVQYLLNHKLISLLCTKNNVHCTLNWLISVLCTKSSRILISLHHTIFTVWNYVLWTESGIISLYNLYSVHCTIYWLVYKEQYRGEFAVHPVLCSLFFLQSFFSQKCPRRLYSFQQNNSSWTERQVALYLHCARSPAGGFRNNLIRLLTASAF